MSQITDDDREMLDDFRQLWAEADCLWEQHQAESAFGGYVSGNYQEIYQSLVRLRGRAFTFLEWGSGLGVATIMASRLGFDAYGIEIEPRLVEYSQSFAEAYGPHAQFAHGSFVPDQFDWDPADGSEVYCTVIDAPAAYDELDMQLRDFDVVYAFPWPTEHGLFRNIMREFGNRNALLLSWDVREGIQVIPFNDQDVIEYPYDG